MFKLHRVISAVIIESDDAHGCITQTHQCGPCALNLVCSQSVKAAYAEPSPSDWAEQEPDMPAHRELSFD
jgi:hypothetical protein